MSKRSREEESSWCTIESDPGIFTLLIEKMGVEGVQVEEIYDLDVKSFSNLPHIFGFIFLFKWSPISAKFPNNFLESDADDVFFAKQEIANACATQAILHILLNLTEDSEAKVKLGEVLENFKSFTKELPSDMRGLCLSNSLEIREIHNEFGNLTDLLAFSDDNESESTGSRDPFHYIALIPKNESVLELDGLKDAPIIHASLASWQESALEVIKKKISNELGGEDIRYNLLAIVSDRRKSLKDKIAELTDVSITSSDIDKDYSGLSAKLFSLKDDLAVEESKWTRYRKEWAERQSSHRTVQAKPDILPNLKLSSQVEELMKSMGSKGLLSKYQK